MNACRNAVRTLLMLALLVGWAAGQTPEPAAPAGQPPAPNVQPSLPQVSPPAPASQLPPNQSLPPQMPGVPDAGFPRTPPTLPPGLPNLIAPPPGDVEGIGAPPAQPGLRPSNNPLLTLFDTDGDGGLSGDEVEDAPARLWELDRNLDGQLSPDELGLVLAPRWQERRRGVPGYLPSEPTPPQPNPPVVPKSPVGDERPQFEVYPLRGLDPGRTLASLQQLLKDQPEVRLTFDGRTQSILALAPPSTHAKIRNALADLLEGERTGIPGFAPGMESPTTPETGLPVMPRVVPLYNARAPEILRIIRQIYRDRIYEPGTQAPAGESRAPGGELPPPEEPTVPPGKMVIGEGAEPNTIVVSAEDELFFQVLDLIERLDGRQEPNPEETAVPPGQ